MILSLPVFVCAEGHGCMHCFTRRKAQAQFQTTHVASNFLQFDRHCQQSGELFRECRENLAIIVTLHCHEEIIVKKLYAAGQLAIRRCILSRELRAQLVLLTNVPQWAAHSAAAEQLVLLSIRQQH